MFLQATFFTTAGNNSEAFFPLAIICSQSQIKYKSSAMMTLWYLNIVAPENESSSNILIDYEEWVSVASVLWSGTGLDLIFILISPEKNVCNYTGSSNHMHPFTSA